jgi:hypothetical protein
MYVSPRDRFVKITPVAGQPTFAGSATWSYVIE